MTSTTTEPRTVADEQDTVEINFGGIYGKAAGEVISAVDEMTDEQAAATVAAQTELDQTAWAAAADRLDEVMSYLDPNADLVDDLADDDMPGHQVRQRRFAYTAVNAVIARDRGLITEQDFVLLTEPYVAAGLTLPTQITGDAEVTPATPIEDMTSDCIADHLLQGTFGGEQYGAVIALTGYNYGELLASPWVRRFVRWDADQMMCFDWQALEQAYEQQQQEESADGSADTNDMDDDALNFLMLAADMYDGGQLDDKPNSEAYLHAAAWTLGMQHMIDPYEVHIGESEPVS